MVIKSTGDSRLVKKTRGSAGYDVLLGKNAKIKPGTNYVPLNIRLVIPAGYFVETYTRSSTLKKTNILVLNSIIDSDYRGEIHLICYSFNNESIVLNKGEAICQLVVHKQIDVENWTNLVNNRNGGLGSTDNVKGDRHAYLLSHM